MSNIGEFQITANEQLLLSFLGQYKRATRIHGDTLRDAAAGMWHKGWIAYDGSAYTLTDLGGTVARQLGIPGAA